MKQRCLSKERTFFLLLLFVILSFLSPIFGETETSLNVPNAPPYLIKEIPSQSWPENESLIDAFDLDEYFEDPEGMPLIYYNSSINDIYVSIDPITNMVSFFPRPGYYGQKNITFYASDTQYDTLSNIVTLSVGLDTEPPKWYFPNIDKTIVYQNDIVTFYTNWTDDRNLQEYIFSINQGAGWDNYSATSFSGIENISSSRVQIRAPAFNIVYWRYYAFDSSGNMNVTAIQNFTVAAQELPPEGGGGGGGGGDGGDSGGLSDLFGKIDVLQIRKVEDFQLSFYELKVSLKQGTSKTRVLKITNIGLEEILINLSSPKLKDFVVFSSTNFSILPGKSKEITIDFYAPERTIPGQYFGYINAQSNKINKSIPTVLDVQGIDLEFDIVLNISEEYKLVKPGKEVKVNMTLINLKDLKNVDASLYYAIKDYTGKVYNFSEEEVSFFSSLFLERSLQVPEIAPEGPYLFYVRASDNKNIAIDSVDFEVGTRFNFSSFVKIGSIILLILIFAILLAVFMAKYKRDKKKERLLELYIMLNKLKELIKQNKEEEALELFIKIKEMYREPVPKEVFNDKERLKKEIGDLYTYFSKDKTPEESTKENKASKAPLAPTAAIPKNKLDPQKYMDYIQECRKKGLTDDYIKKSLLDKGWPGEEINNAFNLLESKKQTKKQVSEKKEEKNKPKK